MAKLYALLPRRTGYDIVRLVSPLFVELKAERLFSVYRYLRRHNKAVVLGGYGMDWYWVSTCCNDSPLRYSDFNIGPQLRTNQEALAERADWLGTAKGQLNQLIANDCDAIATCLYEYWACYTRHLPHKTVYLPLPIDTISNPDAIRHHQRIKIFIGINRSRSAYKGTDIMLAAAEAIAAKYPTKVELQIAVSVPFAEYQAMMNDSDIILDQLYSYTPSMNSLLAMAKGIICVGGGEPECYELLKDTKLRAIDDNQYNDSDLRQTADDNQPNESADLQQIINVLPNYDSVYTELERLIQHPERIPTLKRQSIAFVRRYHHHLLVAQGYLDLYQSILTKKP